MSQNEVPLKLKLTNLPAQPNRQLSQVNESDDETETGFKDHDLLSDNEEKKIDETKLSIEQAIKKLKESKIESTVQWRNTNQ